MLRCIEVTDTSGNHFYLYVLLAQGTRLSNILFRKGGIKEDIVLFITVSFINGRFSGH